MQESHEYKKFTKEAVKELAKIDKTAPDKTTKEIPENQKIENRDSENHEITNKTPEIPEESDQDLSTTPKIPEELNQALQKILQNRFFFVISGTLSISDYERWPNSIGRRG